MHIDYNNPMHTFLLGGHMHTFLLGGQILETVSVENNLGVMVRNDLNVFSQCIKVAKTANQVLGR